MGKSSSRTRSNGPELRQPRAAPRPTTASDAGAEMLASGAMAASRSKPEVLAPAGDLDALKAALAAGADAVYFGLQEGFNARARTGNFALADLAATVARIHRAGAKAHLAVNTLVFEPELGHVETIVRRAAECGVDALILQDPAVAVL